MTNSYNLSPRPKIVFFHGLNNNPECFRPLMECFQERGHETEMIILPGHGQNRHEARNLKAAEHAFSESMKNLKGPYHAVCFSQGALYLQLWLRKNPGKGPLRQILLSPALYIRKQLLIEKALKIIPSFIVIKSLAPRQFRRYEILTAGEYNTLVQGILAFQKFPKEFPIPTLVMIDPKDELVHAQNLKLHHSNVEYIERPELNKGLGGHHILFHPDYFNDQKWQEFTRKMLLFLELNSEV